MTAQELVLAASRQLQAAGCASPLLDARLLLAHAWQRKQTYLLAHMPDEVPERVKHAFQGMVKRRSKREPVAYIVGEKEFWSLNFMVTPDVLIPRPETEHLIEATLDAFRDKSAPLSFCEIGTGSGCIAITLACEYEKAEITATDISRAALRIARQNAAAHHVQGRVRFLQGNMFKALPASDVHYDLIISNPPYVGADELAGLEPELGFEPKLALTDEKDGRRYLHELLQGSHGRLKRDGRLIMETGLSGLPGDSIMKPAIMKLEHEIYDLAGHLRAGVYRKK